MFLLWRLLSVFESGMCSLCNGASPQAPVCEESSPTGAVARPTWVPTRFFPLPFPAPRHTPDGLTVLTQQKTSCPEKPADSVSLAALAEGTALRVPSYFWNQLGTKSPAPAPGAAWTRGQKALLSSLMCHT